jgi:hypothetical protein
VALHGDAAAAKMHKLHNRPAGEERRRQHEPTNITKLTDSADQPAGRPASEQASGAARPRRRRRCPLASSFLFDHYC